MGKKLKLFQIDAFTDQVFGGNPAAILVLDQWIPEEKMQQIADENNLAETAFVVQKDLDNFEIRWFTPTVEVDLCGHATLAAAHVLFTYFEHALDKINFHSQASGLLSVTRNGENLSLDFPVDVYKKIAVPEELINAFGPTPIESYKGKTDYVLLFSNQEDIEKARPNLDMIKRIKARGVIISAPGKKVDFVSRFFAPQSGIDEDPVTGSAHTTLTPIWSEKLGKDILTAKQLSRREGNLYCELKGNRVRISGKAVTYLIGQLEIQ